MSPDDMEQLSALLSEFVDEIVHEVVRGVLAEDKSAWASVGSDSGAVARDDDARIAPDAGVVYFVRSEASGLIKIGFTANLKNRIRALTNGSGGNIEVLHHMPGTFADERELHRLFAVHRRKGEWFDPANEILDHVRALQVAAAVEAA